jgi:hypothetical protein
MVEARTAVCSSPPRSPRSSPVRYTRRTPLRRHSCLVRRGHSHRAEGHRRHGYLTDARPTETEFCWRADMEDTRNGRMESRDDANEVAGDGYDALIAGWPSVVAGSFENRLEAEIGPPARRARRADGVVLVAADLGHPGRMGAPAPAAESRRPSALCRGRRSESRRQSWVAGPACNPRVAGPSRTSPSGLNRDPWSGQSQDRSASFQVSVPPR